jgi:uncharacterized membrane protein HdeD (DUF308 family)
MTRRTATLLWGAMLVVPLAFGAVAARAAREAASPELRWALLWGAALACAVNVALAWVLPPRLGPARAHDRDAVAFTRLLVALALCEAGAIAPLVAYTLSRDARLLAVLAAGLVGVLALFPSSRRWEALRPAAAIAERPLPEVR